MGARKFQDGDLIRITTDYDRFYTLKQSVGRVQSFQNGYYNVKIQRLRSGEDEIALVKARQAYIATNNKEVYEYEQWEKEQARNAEPLVGATNI